MNAAFRTSSIARPIVRLWARLRGGHASPTRLAISVAIGLFVGSQPVFGLHLPLCALICLPLRLDLVTAYLAAHISTPPLGPVLLLAEIELGSLLLTAEPIGLSLERVRRAGAEGMLGFAFLGSAVLGAGLAGAGGVLTSLATTRVRRRSALAAAALRTRRRYAELPLMIRLRVAAKLDRDSYLAWIAKRGQPLGSLVELGNPLGERGLCLLELGVARSLESVSDNQDRSRMSRIAGGGARFRCVALEHWAWQPADTVLFDPALATLDTEHALDVVTRALARLEAGRGLLLLSLPAESSGAVSLWRRVRGLSKRAEGPLRLWPELRALLDARGARYETELDPDSLFRSRLFVAVSRPELTSPVRP